MTVKVLSPYFCTEAQIPNLPNQYYSMGQAI